MIIKRKNKKRNEQKLQAKQPTWLPAWNWTKRNEKYLVKVRNRKLFQLVLLFARLPAIVFGGWLVRLFLCSKMCINYNYISQKYIFLSSCRSFDQIVLVAPLHFLFPFSPVRKHCCFCSLLSVFGCGRLLLLTVGLITPFCPEINSRKTAEGS